MSSLLAVIRAATQPETIIDSPEGVMPGADASNPATPPLAASTTEDQMSDTQKKPGTADADAGQAEAIAKATSDGRAEGVKAANERMGAIIGADGIKGDGKRMAAALDLATSSPDMSAEAVGNFVKANVPETKAAAGDGWGDYASRRLAAAGLAQPDNKDKGTAGRQTLAASVDRTNKRRK
jgi:hypothetical protein